MTALPTSDLLMQNLGGTVMSFSTDADGIMAEGYSPTGAISLLGLIPAAIARLKTLTDTYPLYSQSDDALMMLGRAYEDEATILKNSKILEAGSAGTSVFHYTGAEKAVEAYLSLADEVLSRA